jgi:hypothetical protein
MYIFDTTLNADLFQKILTTTLLPAGKKLGGKGWLLYMDNDPKHTLLKLSICSNTRIVTRLSFAGICGIVALLWFKRFEMPSIPCRSV